MIELINFSKRYGDLLAVDDLNLKIEPGELFGFIGPNGAGKSTTIRFLATLLKASGGDGIVNGHRVSREPLAVRRSIGYMPDSFGVYDGMKVWEFLDFFAVAYQIPRGRRKQVIGDVLDLLDLTGKREAFVNSLSRGMKQRLCLAKTLVHDPPVLILDEPSSGLDPRARMEVKALLEGAAQDGQDDPDLQPHLDRVGRLLHFYRHHRAGQAADAGADRGRLSPHSPQPHSPHPLPGKPRRRRVDHPQHARNARPANGRRARHRGTGRRRSADGRTGGEARGRGVRITSFADKEPTLEDVFMLVTKGAVA